MQVKTLTGVDVRGKKVLLRADLNVPVRDGQVSSLTRIERLMPTVQELTAKGAKLIIISHFGRPGGKKVAEFSLAPIAEAVRKVLQRQVIFVSDCCGEIAEEAVAKLQDGEILILENTRFYPEEEENDRGFAKKLSDLADLYVNDAFSVSHRAHGSTVGVAEFLPAYAGRLTEAELMALDKAVTDPAHPVMAVVGGSKVSTKLDLLLNLLTKVDTLVIGGAMANTFLAAQGQNVGSSLQEPSLYETALAVLKKAKEQGCQIILPVDALTAPDLKQGVKVTEAVLSDILPGMKILDIGSRSVDRIKKAADLCRTVVWNGPLGAFETEPFDKATTELAKFVAEKTKSGQLVSVAGGGDTVAALQKAGTLDKFTYVSTAGGAFLEWLEGKTLPGIAVLMKD